MTRINVVPVEILSDKHLLAEYKEITRPFNKAFKRANDGTMHEVTIPSEYCLGKGHETFFFDKLGWLLSRYKQLYHELMNRGVNLDKEKFRSIVSDFHDNMHNGLFGWYEPTQEAMYLNMARLAKRSNMSSVLDEISA